MDMTSPEPTPKLKLCLDAIAMSRFPDDIAYFGDDRFEPFGDIWDVMDAIFEELDHEDAGDLLADAVHVGWITPDQAVGALSCGMWAGKTNGADLDGTMNRWLLEGEDPMRIFIALNQGIFWLGGGIKLFDTLTELRQRWPELTSLCDKWRRSVIEQQLLPKRRVGVEANTLILQMANEPNSVHTVSLNEFMEAAKEKEASTSHATDSNSPLT